MLFAILGSLALLSGILTLWQWSVARRFPLHRRSAVGQPQPAVSILKPLKGTDETLAACLRSWFAQQYSAPVQLLFGVAHADDPVCRTVRELIAEHPHVDARLVICSETLGANAKVSTLIQLERQALHPVVLVSDADVRVDADFVSQLLAPLQDREVGLSHCFYRLANPATVAMRLEAIAINADFWSQVLQSASLKPVNFALGAAMALRREVLQQIGGFSALADYLADDYYLGWRVAQSGRRIEFAWVTAECWSPPMTLAAVWHHQLRWARTIANVQPAPYFCSILANATLWPALVILAAPTIPVVTCAGVLLCSRIIVALDCQRRMDRSTAHYRDAWLVPLKDILIVLIWAFAFIGDGIRWATSAYRVKRDGTLQPVE